MRRFLLGSLVAIVASFPIGALTALVFRFPIPFGAYASGLDAVVPSLYAVAFYGMLGGFIAQGGVGGIAAVSVPPNAEHGLLYSSAAAVIAAVPAVLILSVLDWIIGPW